MTTRMDERTDSVSSTTTTKPSSSFFNETPPHRLCVPEASDPHGDVDLITLLSGSTFVECHRHRARRQQQRIPHCVRIMHWVGYQTEPAAV